MYKRHIVYIFLTGLLVILSCAIINAQTANGANLKTRPQLLQTKPQLDISKAQIDQFVKSLPVDRQKTFKTVGTIMANQLIENLKSSKPDKLKQEDAAKIITAGMDKTSIITNAANEQALVQNTQMAIINAMKAKEKEAAAKVETSNYIMQIIQEEITALTDLLSGWTDEPIIQEVSYRSCTKLSDGRYEIVKKVVVMSKEQLEILIGEMESQLNTLADMNQMDMLALQDSQNNQAQLMQMMSNMQKYMHDTATAIIRNLK